MTDKIAYFDEQHKAEKIIIDEFLSDLSDTSSDVKNDVGHFTKQLMQLESIVKQEGGRDKVSAYLSSAKPDNDQLANYLNVEATKTYTSQNQREVSYELAASAAYNRINKMMSGTSERPSSAHIAEVLTDIKDIPEHNYLLSLAYEVAGVNFAKEQGQLKDEREQDKTYQVTTDPNNESTQAAMHKENLDNLKNMLKRYQESQIDAPKETSLPVHGNENEL